MVELDAEMKMRGFKQWLLLLILALIIVRTCKLGYVWMCHVCGREGVRLTGYGGKDIWHGGIDTPYSMYNEM